VGHTINLSVIPRHNMYENISLYGTYDMQNDTIIFNSIFINRWEICYLHESIIDHYQNKTLAVACILSLAVNRARDKLR